MVQNARQYFSLGCFSRMAQEGGLILFIPLHTCRVIQGGLIFPRHMAKMCAPSGSERRQKPNYPSSISSLCAFRTSHRCRLYRGAWERLLLSPTIVKLESRKTCSAFGVVDLKWINCITYLLYTQQILIKLIPQQNKCCRGPTNYAVANQSQLTLIATVGWTGIKDKM